MRPEARHRQSGAKQIRSGRTEFDATNIDDLFQADNPISWILQGELTLGQLVAAELIREHPNDTETEYIFKHVLTYETTYNILLLQQRRVYHKRIADHMAPMYYLRGEEYASIVAHHYEQGEVWDRALTYLIRLLKLQKQPLIMTTRSTYIPEL